MTGRSIRILTKLIQDQSDGVQMPCPCCGEDKMKTPIEKNPMSRFVDGVYLCKECRQWEDGIAEMNNCLPFSSWKITKPKVPPSNYKNMKKEAVLYSVLNTQISKLYDFYESCKNNLKGNVVEYEQEAIEKLPGLTKLQFLSGSLRFKFQACDGGVWFYLSDCEDGSIDFRAGYSEK